MAGAFGAPPPKDLHPLDAIAQVADDEVQRE
jgi:hypothetical protein